MSQKQGRELQSGYMDGVRVKISEKYKPPPRINLAITYSQRISMNKDLHYNLPKYDFSLETSVKDKMKEWRAARSIIVLKRIEQLDKVKEERENQNEIANQDSKAKEATINENNANLEHIKEERTGGVLIPMQATQFTNILTPIPLINQLYSCKPTDKSPFNISDFEADTSSPFDNMELKTINDMEELKIVLENDDKQNVQSNIQNSYTAASYSSQDNQYNYTPQKTATTNHSFQPSNNLYNTTNGYHYYNHDTLHPNINSTFNYTTVRSEYSSSFDAPTPQAIEVTKIPFRSVPDIMKALQTELNDSHLNSNSFIPDYSANVNCNESEASHSPNRDIVNPNDTVNVDHLENPYEQLPQNLQDVCNVVSSMGFPLPRVARACKDIGDDNKKIVEHLLVLSELLAFGFSETKVSSALLQCNNDRDKALELLIL